MTKAHFKKNIYGLMSSKNARAVFLIVFITFNFPTVFSQPAPESIFESTTGEVVFVSEAPLETIQASSKELRGLIRVSDRTFAFTIPTQSFTGFNSPLQQEHFYENYIESQLYPKASYSGKIIEPVDLLTDGEYIVRAKGKAIFCLVSNS